MSGREQMPERTRMDKENDCSWKSESVIAAGGVRITKNGPKLRTNDDVIGGIVSESAGGQ